MRKAKLSGLTRLEIIFCFPDSNDYCFGLPFMKHHFLASRDLTWGDQIMNDPEIHDFIHSEIDFFRKANAFTSLRRNILVVGKTRVWIEVASTCHPNHFIGTKRVLHLKPGMEDKASLKCLRDFLFRYSTPGAKIFAYFITAILFRLTLFAHLTSIRAVALRCQSARSQHVTASGCHHKLRFRSLNTR